MKGFMAFDMTNFKIIFHFLFSDYATDDFEWLKKYTEAVEEN